MHRGLPEVKQDCGVDGLLTFVVCDVLCFVVLCDAVLCSVVMPR